MTRWKTLLAKARVAFRMILVLAGGGVLAASLPYFGMPWGAVAGAAVGLLTTRLVYSASRFTGWLVQKELARRPEGGDSE